MWQKYNSFDSLKAKMRYLIDPSVSCKIATNDAPVSVATSRTSSTDKWMSQTKHRMPNDQSWCAKFNFFFTNNSWWTLVRKIINCVRNRRKFSFVDLKSNSALFTNCCKENKITASISRHSESVFASLLFLSDSSLNCSFSLSYLFIFIQWSITVNLKLSISEVLLDGKLKS